MKPPFDKEFDAESDDIDKLEKAKSKLIMDFGLTQPAPQKVTIEVLRQMIHEKPERISRVIRKWLRPD
jgi:flagellar biosynthesis/type III secretory pathway M-ring protein FliF/YscJ